MTQIKPKTREVLSNKYFLSVTIIIISPLDTTISIHPSNLTVSQSLQSYAVDVI